MLRKFAIAACVVLITVSACRAGLYYSGESYSTLPAQWRGFLMDQRLLRNISIKPKLEADISPIRLRYLDEARKLRERGAKDSLNADVIADLGALYIRLGEIDKAIEVLRPGQRKFPNHFAINANFG